MKKLFYSLLLMCAAAGASLLVDAENAVAQTTKWVDQAGGSDGNNGNTAATAYASLQHAINNSVSGTAATRSIIYVKNGTYSAAGLTNPAGANTAILLQNLDYLTVQAVSGHNPKIAPAAPGTVSLSIANCQNLIVDGIVSDQSVAQSDNWQVFGSNNLTVRNCAFDGGQRGIKFYTALTTALIEKSLFKNIAALSTSDALEFLEASYFGVTIQDNTFQSNTRHIRLHVQNGNTISDFAIRRNLMLGTAAEESLRLIGAARVMFENNVVMYSAQQGMYIDSGCNNITIRHNSFFKAGFEIIRTKITSPDMVIENNIFYGNGTHAALAAAVSPLAGENHNLVFNAGTATETATQPAVTAFGANTKVGQDPFFVSTAAGSEDLHLQNGSPAIGAGSDLGVTDDVSNSARPQPAASNPDLGAYENSRATPDNGGTNNGIKIMPLGDSITSMYTDHDSYRRPLWFMLQNGGFNVDFVGSQSLNKNGPPPHPDFDMDHEGHSGWRADHMLAQVDAFAGAYQPDIVLIHLGSNDVFEYQSNSGTIAELGQIIDKLRLANPNVKILLGQIIPSIYEASAIVDLNQRMPALAASKNTPQSPVVVVDHWTGFSLSQDMYDGVHPNDAGDQKMADRWYAALVNFLNNVPPPTVKWVDQLGGNDANDGNTEATAYASLQHAINNSTSGTAANRAIINVKNGTYGATGLTNAGGASTAILIQNLDYLTIQAVAGHAPKVNPAVAGMVSISVANSHHLIIDGLVSEQTTAQSDNWQVFGSNNLTVRSCTFDGGQRGINFSSTLNTVLVEKCMFKNIAALSTSDALEFLQASYSGVIVQDNTFLNNKRHIRLHLQAGNTISNFVIRRNLMNGTAGEEALRLIGAAGVVLENNVVMNSGQQGLYIDSGCSNVTIRHNTFFKNGFEAIRTRVNSADVVIKNNIFYGNGTHAPLAASLSPLPGEASNLIFNSGITTETISQPAVTVFGAGTKLGEDPLFMSTVAGSENLHLQNNSPAIAAGADVGVADDHERGARPQPTSTQPDLGAYESPFPVVAVPDIAAAPSAHNYGNVTVGSTANQTIVVSNTGAASLEVSATTLAGANSGQFAITSGGAPFTLAPGTARNIVVSFKPTSTGAKSASLNLASNDPDENPLAVALSGNGVAAAIPDIAVAPNTHNYGNVTTGSAVNKTIVVSNTGSANLEVSAATLAGANSNQFAIASGGAPFTLAPGAARNVVVSFKPTSTGVKSASLNLASNDPDENPLAVALAGNGVAAPAPTYVLLAEKKVEVKGQLSSDGNIHSNGEIIFNDGNPSTHSGNLTAVGKITIKRNNTINGKVTAGGELMVDRHATINGTAAGYAAVKWVNNPWISFSAGGTKITVARYGTRSLAPASYGDVNVEAKGTLKLKHNGSSGDYFFKKLVVKESAVLSIDVTSGPVTIHAADQLLFEKFAKVQIVPYGDKGSAWVTFKSLSDVVLGENALILGSIIAPQYKVEIKKGAKFKGSIRANEILIEEFAIFLDHASTRILSKDQLADERFEGEAGQVSVVGAYELAQNYPNPFNPSTTISFALPEAGEVTLRIFNTQGQLVRTLVSGMLSAGRHQKIWNGADDSGRPVASGIYYCQLQAGGFSKVMKMSLVQ
jgi:parallel beta-helix repeat protein